MRVRGEGLEDDAEVAEEAADGFAGETGAVEFQAQAQLRAGVGGEGEGEIGLFVESEFAVVPRTAGSTEDGVQLVVFKDDDALEERASAGDFAPRLHAGEGGVLVGAQGDPLRAEFAQPRDERGVRGEANADGQRIDEEPDHLAGTLDGGAAAGAGRAEDDVAFAAVTAEEEAPRALDEGVEGEVVRGGEVAQRAGGGGGEADVAIALRVLRRAAGKSFDDERRRSGEAAESFAPVGCGGRRIQRLQPVDVVAVGAGERESGRGAGAEGGVKREDFAEDDGEGAAVEQGVVKSPDEAEFLCIKLNEHEAHERGFVHGEAAAAVVAQPGSQAAFAILGRGFAPVLLVPGRIHFLRHPLLGLGLPVEGRAEDRMPRDDLPPGGAQGGGVDFLAQGADHLLEVHAAAGRGDGVEKHAVLERRERVGGGSFSLAVFPVRAVGWTQIHARQPGEPVQSFKVFSSR